jgi:hypothetical protein
VTRFVTGAILVLTFVPLFARLVGIVLRGWRDGTLDGDLVGVVSAVLVAIGVLAGYGAAMSINALRGKKAPSVALPFLIAIPALVGVTVYREGALAPVIQGRQGSAAVGLLSLFVIGLAIPAHVAVHEVGHAAAARLVGWRFQALRIGPLLVHRDGDRLRVARNRLRVSGLLGSALSIPTRNEGFAGAYAITILGGPAATFAATVAFWVAARVVSPPESDTDVVMSFVLWHATFVGAFLGVVNLVPFRLRSGVRSDGWNVWLALTARTAAAREVLRWTLNSSRGIRPREWDTTAEALTEAAETDPRHAPEVRLAALSMALDTGDYGRAESILARGCGSRRREHAVRQEFAMKASLVASLVHGDAGAARSRLAEVGQTGMREYPLVAEAAAALAENRPAEARALLREWKEAVARTGLPGIRVGNEWAEELLEARLAAPTSDVA